MLGPLETEDLNICNKSQDVIRISCDFQNKSYDITRIKVKNKIIKIGTLCKYNRM